VSAATGPAWSTARVVGVSSGRPGHEPRAQRLEPHVPTTRESRGHRVVVEEAVDVGVAVPERNQRHPAEVGPAEERRAERHTKGDLGAAQTLDVGRLGRLAQQRQGRAGTDVREVETQSCVLPIVVRERTDGRIASTKRRRNLR
jgi:hypothetical protein